MFVFSLEDFKPHQAVEFNTLLATVLSDVAHANPDHIAKLYAYMCLYVKQWPFAFSPSDPHSYKKLTTAQRVELFTATTEDIGRRKRV